MVFFPPPLMGEGQEGWQRGINPAPSLGRGFLFTWSEGKVKSDLKKGKGVRQRIALHGGIEHILRNKKGGKNGKNDVLS
jgi:hypothetical protein